MAKISRSRVTASEDTYMDESSNDFENRYDDATPSDSRERVSTSKSPISSGWGAKVEERKETVKAPILKLKDNGTRIIKILDEFPPVKYKRHYLNSRGRYYTCTQTGCPLCRKGSNASWAFILNVVDMEEREEVKTWTFGIKVSTQLQTIAENKGALDDAGAYFEVCHIKDPHQSAPATSVTFMRGRYLPDEHDIEPLSEGELDILETQKYGAEVVYISSNSYLEEIAEDILPSDLPQRRKF